MSNTTQQGVALAVGAYSMWGLAPVYFKALDHVTAVEVLAHRVLWSLLLTVLVILLLRRLQPLLAILKNPRVLKGLLLSTALIGANWGVFIWAIQDNRILSASLGYYINPLVNILLGMLFLGEKLDTVRKVAAALCVFAVLLELIRFGSVPWVALFLALSFATYGLVRKRLGVDSLTGLAVETALLLPLALGYVILAAGEGARFVGTSWEADLLLLLAGPVTTLPLLCFTAAANRISLTALGFFQYIGPTGMFLLAVFVYQEPVTEAKLTTFVLIWSALGLLIVNSIRRVMIERTMVANGPRS